MPDEHQRLREIARDILICSLTMPDEGIDFQIERAMKTYNVSGQALGLAINQVELEHFIEVTRATSKHIGK
jgi:hypothetical protein